MTGLRVALFACAYDEMDGVANFVRHFEDYAGKRNLPLLVVHGGAQEGDFWTGTVRRLAFLRRFPKFTLDKKHDFDLLFWRYFTNARTALNAFRPDLVHITGPSDVGMLGALLAHRLRLPLAASWHTNLHQYAQQRARSLLRLLPYGLREACGTKIRKLSLVALVRYYRIPGMLFAPNLEWMAWLQALTGKECHLMSRGVDTELFSPKRRSRRDGPFTIGYAGRLTVEKNVEMLADLEKDLLDSGKTAFRFLIAGQGASEPWLRKT